MANVTDPLVSQLSGTDPQNLMEYITRQRIYDSRYWKEECFGLSVVNVLEKSVTVPSQLQCIGGLPCHFLSLVLKLLQLHPEHDIIYKAFVLQDTFKYTRALGCLYIRLTSRPVEIYDSLESILYDHRKLRIWTGTNQNRWDITTMDQFVYDLLQTSTSSSSSSNSMISSSSLSYLGITIPRLPSRKMLQESGYIPDGPRIASLNKLHTTILQHMTTAEKDNNDDDDNDDNITTEQYATAALQYLKYKANIQQSPAAIQAYEARQQPKSEVQIRPNVDTVTTSNTPITDDLPKTKPFDTVSQQKQEHQQQQQQQQPVVVDATGNASTTTSATTLVSPITVAANKVVKKRNYGSLFKS